MYSLTRVNNRPAPEAFLKQLDKIEGLIPHSLWQSANWGRYLNAVKTEASLLVLLRGEEIRAWAIMTWGRPLKGFKYAYLQRGPVFREPADRDTLLKEIYSQEGDYLLIDPGWEEDPDAARPTRWKPLPYGHIPSDTLLLDLKKSEDRLLAEMKKKGRYNIKLAQSRNLTVKQTSDPASLESDDFYKLMKSTSARKSIPLLPRRDFNAKLIALESRIFVIYTENKAIAAGFLTLYDNTGYYYYSGTDTAYSSLMAAYLLQWEMILYAKSRKAEFYDFLGISPAGAGETHYLSSVSSFKKRFGGMRKSFAAP